MAIAKHVILSAAKNLPSSRLSLTPKPRQSHLRGDFVGIDAGRQGCLPHPHNGFLIVSTLPRLPLAVVGASLVGARSPATKMIAQPVILSDVNESLSNRGHCLH